MSNTAAQLGNLLRVGADINYYTQQSIYWNMLYEANSAKLQDQVKYEEKWEKAFDSATDDSRTKELKAPGYVLGANNFNLDACSQYANHKIAQYNESLSLELADLDIEYDTMRQMYDTLLEELRAEKEADKTAVSTAAQDTGLIQGG